MSIGVYKLSLQQRQNLCYFINLLNLIQVSLGLSITITSIYIVVAISPALYSERSEINYVFVVTGIYGTHVIFHYLIGIKISLKCLKQAQKKSTQGLLTLWICAGGNVIVNFFIICSVLKKIGKHIIRSLKHSLQRAMEKYLKEITWKVTIDMLQYEFQCCGITDFKDWYAIDWLTKKHYDAKSDVIERLKSDSSSEFLEVLPWSCCKVNFPMQCLHDPIQQFQSRHMWLDDPNVVVSSINDVGCLTQLRKPIEISVRAFVITTTFIFFIQVIIFLILRILYTSARNALLLEDPEGVAPGWIFGRGDCGYTGGKSVLEIMAEGETSGETTETSPTTTPRDKLKNKYKKIRESLKRKKRQQEEELESDEAQNRKNKRELTDDEDN